ncbi:MAG: ORF6N domain-containing protein [Verrucomicrobiota bacterium]|nr:ORF6N domain-containing protein [Verrucomicrobiota bacterium]
MIHELRGQRVMLDADLAAIYGVETKALNRAVKRNRDRFPDDFMFQVSAGEWEDLRYQIGTSSSAHGGRRTCPFAFTEHGALQAANVLNSKRSVQMSVFVIRAFIRMRALLSTGELAKKLRDLEKQLTGRLDAHEAAIVRVLQDLMRRPVRRSLALASSPDPAPDWQSRKQLWPTK